MSLPSIFSLKMFVLVGALFHLFLVMLIFSCIVLSDRDTQTRDVLKIFVTNAKFCSKDISLTRKFPSKDEINIKVAKVSLKEKTEGSLSIFQRSKNAILEAIDAVRRAIG